MSFSQSIRKHPCEGLYYSTMTFIQEYLGELSQTKQEILLKKIGNNLLHLVYQIDLRPILSIIYFQPFANIPGHTTNKKIKFLDFISKLTHQKGGHEVRQIFFDSRLGLVILKHCPYEIFNAYINYFIKLYDRNHSINYKPLIQTEEILKFILSSPFKINYLQLFNIFLTKISLCRNFKSCPAFEELLNKINLELNPNGVIQKPLEIKEPQSTLTFSLFQVPFKDIKIFKPFEVKSSPPQNIIRNLMEFGSFDVLPERKKITL